MPKRFRLTRRMTIGMTEDAHRTLRRFASENGLSEDEALSFVFENWDGITDDDRVLHRLRQFKNTLPDRNS